jgi:two-component system chemotaxis response regulator CheY
MRVLVADDDPTCRLVLKAAVERLAHECVTACDGEEAWKLLQQVSFDVLITDWMMPGLDGPELCRRVRHDVHGTYTYVVLATSLGEREHVVAGMQAGADDYLTKPLDPFDVQTRLIAAARVTDLHKQVTDFRVALERANGELSQLARTDALTQIGNRLRLHEDLVAIHDRAERYGHGYCVAICDLDFFKSYNDTYGHLTGDEALRKVARTLAAHCRSGDGTYRYGGEEFVVVLADQTVASAVPAVDRLREAVELLGVPHVGRPDPQVITISAGIASWRDAGESATQLLERADGALYRAKLAGRNRVVADEESANAA